MSGERLMIVSELWKLTDAELIELGLTRGDLMSAEPVVEGWATDDAVLITAEEYRAGLAPGSASR